MIDSNTIKLGHEMTIVRALGISKEWNFITNVMNGRRPI